MLSSGVLSKHTLVHSFTVQIAMDSTVRIEGTKKQKFTFRSDGTVSV